MADCKGETDGLLVGDLVAYIQLPPPSTRESNNSSPASRSFTFFCQLSGTKASCRISIFGLVGKIYSCQYAHERDLLVAARSYVYTLTKEKYKSKVWERVAGPYVLAYVSPFPYCP